MCVSCCTQQVTGTTPTESTPPGPSSRSFWEYAQLVVGSDSGRLSKHYFETVFSRIGDRALCIRAALSAADEVSSQAAPPADLHLAEIVAELYAFVDGDTPLSAVTYDFHRHWPEVLGDIQADAELAAPPQDIFLVRTRGKSISAVCSAIQELIDVLRRENDSLDPETTERLAWVAWKLAESIGEREIVALWSAEDQLRDETLSQPLWATCTRYGSLFVTWRLDAFAARGGDR